MKKFASSRKSQIIASAAELFNVHGFYETSMEDIAAAIGVKKPTLYHHVSSKAQIVEWIHNDCVDALAPLLEDAITTGLSPSEILVRTAVDIFKNLDSKPGYLRIYFENHRNLDIDAQGRATKRRDKYFDNLQKVIERGSTLGEFEADDPKLATMAFFGMCNWGYQWYRPQGGVSPEYVGGYFGSLFLNGLRKRANK